METPEKKKKQTLREFFSVGDVIRYFFRTNSKETNVNTRIMHGINRFAIIVFLIGVIYLIIKHWL